MYDTQGFPHLIFPGTMVVKMEGNHKRLRCVFSLSIFLEIFTSVLSLKPYMSSMYACVWLRSRKVCASCMQPWPAMTPNSCSALNVVWFIDMDNAWEFGIIKAGQILFTISPTANREMHFKRPLTRLVNWILFAIMLVYWMKSIGEGLLRLIWLVELVVDLLTSPFFVKSAMLA